MKLQTCQRLCKHDSINPFVPNAPFLYSLKITENQYELLYFLHYFVLLIYNIISIKCLTICLLLLMVIAINCYYIKHRLKQKTYYHIDNTKFHTVESAHVLSLIKQVDGYIKKYGTKYLVLFHSDEKYEIQISYYVKKQYHSNITILKNT